MADFGLSKWYLDCVTDAGEVYVLYSAALRWGSFCLNYSSILEAAGGAVSERHSLRALPEPRLTGESLVWRPKPLRVDGEWKADSAGLRSTIFSSDAGAVEWHCLMPRAHARIGLRKGWGYAERLVMNIVPWNLPLRTLRWGRFLCGRESVVWIDWCGEFARTLVYRNGQPVGALSVEDTQIALADGSRLTMDRSLVIREGPLGLAPFCKVPGIRDSLPARLLGVVECKWRSKARLLDSEGQTSDGWAIHEKVEWPR